VPDEQEAADMSAPIEPGDTATRPASTDAGNADGDTPEVGAGDELRPSRRLSGSGGDDGSNGGADGGGDAVRRRGRLVPALAALLMLLLAAVVFLWLTRPDESAVRTGDYAEALQAARSGVVDLTSFDYLTLDDDIEQVRRVATGDLEEESVAQLDERRQQITDAQAVVNTEIVGAGVTRVDGSDATVLLVIQSTQASLASAQPQIVRYRIEVTLEKEGDRWLLSGIKGTENPGDQ
jgi:Mce-associated membrane protein